MIQSNKIGQLEYLTAEGIRVPHCFTTRSGGVSAGHLSSLNLGFNRGDARETVLENYRLLGNAIGFRTEDIVRSSQTHSDVVWLATKEDRGAGICAPGLPECDALITREPGLALVVLTADCTPILFWDSVTGAVGAAHAGWRGTVSAIAEKTVLAMAREFGSRPADIHAAIGPNIGQCHFETDADVPEALISAFGEEIRQYILRDGAKYRPDLKAINAWILRCAGVTEIDISSECTCCRNERFWSHRYTGGLRGSQGAVIVCGEADR